MSTNYPAAKDDNTTLPNPTGSSYQSNPDHGTQHANANDAIKALETKLGIGNTSPSSTGLLLVPTGAGTTAWSQLTSAQLAATLTDETGTGSAVFANTPTLVTPKADTINEATLNNGVTVGGVNFKSGAITTANSVTNNAIATGVQTSKLTNPYKFRVYRNTAFSTINGTITLVHDGVDYDTGSNYNTTTGRFTAPIAGYYHFDAHYGNSTAGAGVFFMSIAKNGTMHTRGQRTNGIAANDYFTMGCDIKLSTSDYIEIQIFAQSSYAAEISSTMNWFSGHLISAA
jgi:hypothetical protein